MSGCPVGCHPWVLRDVLACCPVNGLAYTHPGQAIRQDRVVRIRTLPVSITSESICRCCGPHNGSHLKSVVWYRDIICFPSLEKNREKRAEAD